MSADEHDCQCPPVGVPAYMATFADLMALLMCFFVLLLSFAEMDVLKFKRLAGSMRTAFGVQRVVEANEIPMGTSIIAQEFSPGRPEPTPINDVKQRTSEEDQRNLQVQCTPDQLTDEVTLTQKQFSAQDKALVDQLAEMIEETRRDAVDLANALSTQIKKGEVEIETRGRDITVRIKEQGSFASGSAQLRSGFKGVLHDVRDVLSEKSGDILVQGHTDNIAISTSRFRSNWELS
ncbi:MAG: MotB family protein, partial [Pseudomonadales bacterium]